MASYTAGSAQDGLWTGMKSRLSADSAGKWKGVQLRFTWPELEGNTLGDYAPMNKIQSYLDQISAYPGRRLIVFFQIKTFGSTSNAVPLYMRNSATYADGTSYAGSGNGQYSYDSGNGGPGGFVPNMHVPAVRDRFKALMQEFANRFNTNPYLEAISFSEASINRPRGAAASWPEGKPEWFDGMTNAFQDMKTRLTNVQICQWINALRSDMVGWVPDLRSAGIGLGMPDACPEDSGFRFRNDIPGYESTAPGNIQHLQESSGTAIIMAHVAQTGYDGTVAGRCQVSGTIQGQPHVYPDYPGVGVSRQAIRDFSVNDAKATHILWTHNPGNQPNTGARDPNIPAGCQATSDDWTAYGTYAGRSYNTITDEWINDPTSNITTITTRPTGW